jgi:O-antigen/teichoic acid export membrane protein
MRNKLFVIMQSTTLLVVIDQMLFSGTNFLLTLFLARQLDIKSFGFFTAIVLIVFLLMSICNALIIQPFQVSIAKIEKKNEYFSFLFFSQLSILIFIIVAVKSVTYFLPIGSAYSIHSSSIICFISAYLLQDFFRKIFLGIQQLPIVLMIDLLFLFLITTSFYTLQSQIKLPQVFWVIGLANIISTMPALKYVIKNIQWFNNFRTYLKDHYAQGKWLLSVSVLQWASSNFFVLVSGLYLGIEALAALRLVQSFFGIVNILFQTVENYFLPRVASIYIQDRQQAKSYLWGLTLRGMVVFGVLLSALFIFSKQTISLAGGIQYQSYAYVVRLMVVLYFFIFISYPLRIAVRVLLLNKLFFIGYLISFISSICSFHFLLQYIGLSGAVMGLITNQVLMIIFWQHQLKKQHYLLWK